MNEYIVIVTIPANTADEAKEIVERGIDKQGIAVKDIVVKENSHDRED